MTTPATSAATERPYLLERVGEAAVVQYYAEGFEALPVPTKILAWHLYEAALAGRDIYYDQRYRHNLALRATLEALVRQAAALPEESRAAIVAYAKLVWIHTGPYHSLTARKFVIGAVAPRRWPPPSTPPPRRARASRCGPARPWTGWSIAWRRCCSTPTSIRW